MSGHQNPTPFLTDEQLAERIRLVEARLRDSKPVLASELAEIARVLTPRTQAPVVDQDVQGSLELFNRDGGTP